MENYELNITAPPKRQHNWFPKGYTPHNKGKKWTDYMDMRKAKRVKKYLELGRIKGNATMASQNKIAIVGIKDGKLTAFSSAIDAAKILKAKGVKVSSRNINKVCHYEPDKNGYIRKRAGGYAWYFADQVEKYRDLIK